MDEKVAHEHAGLPEIPPQNRDLLVLVDVVAIDLEVLIGDAALNAVCFRRSEHEHRKDRAVTRPQHGAFAQTRYHYTFILAPRPARRIRSYLYSIVRRRGVRYLQSMSR